MKWIQSLKLHFVEVKKQTSSVIIEKIAAINYLSLSASL